MFSQEFAKQPLAYLIYEEQLHWAKAGEDEASDKNHSPWTPLTILVNGLFEKYALQAHYPLRRKISVNYSPTELCYGMAKVAAKGLSVIYSHELAKPKFEQIYQLPNQNKSHDFVSDSIPIVSGSLRTDNDCMNLALSLLKKRQILEAETKTELYLKSRSVAAILVSPDNTLLETALNTNQINKIEHAEWNLVINWWNKNRKPLPKGARIYTTRKPCKMCAGLLWQQGVALEHIQVFYHEDDQGPFARHTILNQNSFEQKRAELKIFKDYETRI